MYDYYNDMQSCDSGNVKEIGGLTDEWYKTHGRSGDGESVK